MYDARLLWPVAVLMTMFLVSARGPAVAKPVFRKPPPEGVIEVLAGIGRSWSLVELQDGSLMAVGGSNYRISTDGGQSWGDSQPLGEGVSGNGIIRLNSGALALTDGKRLWLSEDDGKTWGEPRGISMLGSPYYDTLIQLSSGGLLVPSRTCYSCKPPDLACEPQSRGTWHGRSVAVEGHGHAPELDVAAVSRSGDLGKTWERSGYLMGWFDEQGIPNGYGAHTSCDEPGVAETADGRVLFLARSQVGRLVYSYSSDGGESWTAVRPTELASSYSPPRLRSIPQTGDLICVWNEVSGEEIRRGYRRGRLSVAISEDSGESWGHFKTIEVSEGLEDVEPVQPDAAIKWVRGRDDVGELPEGFSVFRYANVCFAGDKVYILYAREWLEERGEDEAGMAREQVLRIYPIEYFYQ